MKRISLGSPSSDDPAGYQARKFRELMRAHAEGIEGLHLLPVLDVGTRQRRVEAVCTSAAAEAWAAGAGPLAAEVWAAVGGSCTRRLVRG